MDDDTPRVWVGCLGCYNAGTLAGAWFDASDAPDSMEEFDAALGLTAREPWEFGDDAYASVPIKTVVSEEHGHPVYGPHEELWVMEHDNFGGFLTGECSPGDAKQIAVVMEAITEAGFDLAAVSAWADNTGEKITEWDHPTEESFQEKFAGDHESLSDWAWEFLEDTGFWQDVPEHIMTHQSAIVQSWLDSCEHGGEIWTAPSSTGVYVFWS